MYTASLRAPILALLLLLPLPLLLLIVPSAPPPSPSTLLEKPGPRSRRPPGPGMNANCTHDSRAVRAGGQGSGCGVNTEVSSRVHALMWFKQNRARAAGNPARSINLYGTENFCGSNLGPKAGTIRSFYETLNANKMSHKQFGGKQALLLL